MKYELIGETVPAVEVTLDKDEAMFSQSGGMAWQTEGIKMTTNTNGGIMKGLARKFAGESMFMNTYSSEADGSKVAFASTVPGKIIPINVEEYENGITMQKGAFLCAQPSVNLKVEFTKKFSSGLFGGEGFILEGATGTGSLFLEVDGDAVIRDLEPGEVIKVDTGNVVAFEKSVSYEIETVKGFTNIFLGGEGLFLTKLKGPGRVILQTKNFNDFSGRILSRAPRN